MGHGLLLDEDCDLAGNLGEIKKPPLREAVGGRGAGQKP